MVRSGICVAVVGLIICTTAVLGEDVDGVNARFFATYPEECNGAFLEDGSPAYPPDVYPLSYRTTWQQAEDPPLEMRLYRYQCTIGAYNVGHVFFTANEEGILPLHLAQPTYDVRYVGGGSGMADDGSDAKVEAITLTGFSALARVTNSEVDPDEQVIRNQSYWRGMGDASSSAEWHLVNGEFSLVSFDIDASYDGEVNPIRLWETQR